MEAIKLFMYSRTSTLILLNKISEDKWDKLPDGYPNNVRWNAGHVYVTADDFLTDADDTYESPHPEWNAFFIDGTRPSEWGDEVPSPSEILQALKVQKEYINEFFTDKLENKASVPRDINGTILDTVNASLQFVTWHEGIHLGFTNGISKLL